MADEVKFDPEDKATEDQLDELDNEGVNTEEPAVKEEPDEKTDPRDEELKLLKDQISDLTLRLEESEEILANPKEYEKEKNPKEETEKINYADIDDPVQLAETLKKEMREELRNILAEHEAPIKERRQKEEFEALEEKASKQVAACKKLEDWDKYEPEITRQVVAFEKKFGLKAVVDSDLIKKTYANLRLEGAIARVQKRSKVGSTSEKPGSSASGASKVIKTVEDATEAAYDELSDDEKKVLDAI